MYCSTLLNVAREHLSNMYHFVFLYVNMHTYKILPLYHRRIVGKRAKRDASPGLSKSSGDAPLFVSLEGDSHYRWACFLLL